MLIHFVTACHGIITQFDRAVGWRSARKLLYFRFAVVVSLLKHTFSELHIETLMVRKMAGLPRWKHV